MGSWGRVSLRIKPKQVLGRGRDRRPNDTVFDFSERKRRLEEVTEGVCGDVLVGGGRFYLEAPSDRPWGRNAETYQGDKGRKGGAAGHVLFSDERGESAVTQSRAPVPEKLPALTDLLVPRRVHTIEICAVLLCDCFHLSRSENGTTNRRKVLDQWSHFSSRIHL